MSVPQGYTVVIDGYNLIKHHAAWKSLPLRDARQRLIESLQRTRWPVPVTRILAVFDTSDPNAVTLQPAGNLQVCFATPSADAYIQEFIRTSPAPHRLLVISDDGEILRTAKSHAVQRRPTQWVFQRDLSAKGPRGRPAEPDKPSPPAATSRQITEELARRWLKPSS